ncbi:CBS domain-containing protein [Methanofollis fontis]|nr:CBS domain-containing protein [Methanofollis fontis]
MKLARDMMVRIPSLTTGDLMTRARQVLRDDIFREVAITDPRGRYVGYIDITDALKVTDTKSNVLIEGFVREGAAVAPDAPLTTIASAIRIAGTDMAVVTDGNGIVLGGVMLSDIFPILCTREALRGTVADYMEHNPPVCAPDEHLGRVYARMVEGNKSAYIVMSGSTLTGVISRRDVLNTGRVRKSLESGGKIPVESVMITPAIAIEKDEEVSAAASMMVKHDLSQIPVMDGDTLVGIIDRHGVLNGLSAKE